MAIYHYDDLRAVSPAQGTTRRLAHSEHMMMVIVDFDGGPCPPAPHHSHPHEQISYVAQGPINFYMGEGEGQEITRVETGDLVVIPANLPHTVEVLAETARLVDAFYPLREDFL